MKNLFVSRERVLIQSYREAWSFRVVAMLIFLALFAQVPLLLGALTLFQQRQRLQAQRDAQTAETAALRSQLGPLQDLKAKLQQVRQWEPILRSRLPVSALLGAIESSMPEEAVLGSVSIEADGFDRVSVPGGVYRVPTNYRLVLQGETRAERDDAAQTLNEALLRRLPPGSEEIRNERQARPDGRLHGFVLQYSLKPNGNYHGLGVRRLADPDPL